MSNPVFEKYKKYNQDHIFKFWEELNQDQKEKLLSHAQKIPLNEIERLSQKIITKDKNSDNLDNISDNIDPAKYIKHPSINSNIENIQLWKKAKEKGEEFIKNGKVAAFLVAGGQGTRLGIDAPKGIFGISPIKKKSLFQIFAEKIIYASKKYNTSIPWFIMTSEINHNDTKKFFEDNNYFNFPKNDLFFFKQGMLPAVDKNGKIFLENKESISLSPDGHGGSIKALYDSGSLDIIEKRGIEILSYFQVDNVLVNCIDPAFIGFHVLNNAEISNKAVKKIDPSEKVGVFCQNKENTLIIEYSDLPEKLNYEKDKNGNYLYVMGSIAIHLFSIQFLKKLSQNNSFSLPYHLANKKVKHINQNGEFILPDKPNGYKFETFVFDSLLLTHKNKTLVLETLREEEFSPLKNADGVDSHQSALEHQNNLHKRWLLNALEKSDISYKTNEIKKIEISPLFANSSEEFENKFSSIIKDFKISEEIYIE